ncbi:hypothetical protein C8F01DRAFT_1087450 [Mycena amicta]|nr:hypothetical protein C8F01DRAFT_1087450 [Mycena amicta]
MRRPSAPGRSSSAGDAFWVEPIASSQEAGGACSMGGVRRKRPGRICLSWVSVEGRPCCTDVVAPRPVLPTRQRRIVLAFGPDCGLAKATVTEAEANGKGREGGKGILRGRRDDMRYWPGPRNTMSESPSQVAGRRGGTRLLDLEEPWQQQNDSRTRMSCYSWESKQSKDARVFGSWVCEGGREKPRDGLMREVVSPCVRGAAATITELEGGQGTVKIVANYPIRGFKRNVEVNGLAEPTK